MINRSYEIFLSKHSSTSVLFCLFISFKSLDLELKYIKEKLWKKAFI